MKKKSSLAHLLTPTVIDPTRGTTELAYSPERHFTPSSVHSLQGQNYSQNRLPNLHCKVARVLHLEPEATSPHRQPLASKSDRSGVKTQLCQAWHSISGERTPQGQKRAKLNGTVFQICKMYEWKEITDYYQQNRLLGQFKA